MKLIEIKGVCDHIIHIRPFVAQLKALEVTMFDSFLVHYILCTFPHQYALLKSLTTNIRIRGLLINYSLGVVKKRKHY